MSVTLPVETCLGKDASVVCSAAIDSLPVYYQSGRGTAMLIHSPASAIPLHTQVKLSIYDVTLYSGLDTAKHSKNRKKAVLF